MNNKIEMHSLSICKENIKAIFFSVKRLNLLFVLSVSIIQFVIFKYYFPFASFIHSDSAVYIESAYYNYDINFYLVGYSKFLRLVSVFSTSDYVLVLIQYLLIQLTSFFFLQTVFGIYNPRILVRRLLILFISVNPFFLIVSNLVSSDSLFISISFIWLSLLFRIISNPSLWLVVLQSIILLIAFTIRYNALIYPVVTIFVLLICDMPRFQKIACISLICGLIFIYSLYTCNEYKKLTGIRMFSPFSGWQIANNAMYAYRYVPKSMRISSPEQFRVLNAYVVNHFDSTLDFNKFRTEALLASTFYMWKRDLPLYKFRDFSFSKDKNSSDFKKWASMGTLYRDYGVWLISKYPGYYFNYFLLPNSFKYFAPPVEYLEEYNDGKNFPVRYANEWFKYNGRKLITRTGSTRIDILNYYPIFSGISNVVFLVTCILFWMLPRCNDDRKFRRCIAIVFIMFMSNLFFSIFSTSGALRFLGFMIIIDFISLSIIVDWIVTWLTQNSSFNVKSADKTIGNNLA